MYRENKQQFIGEYTKQISLTNYDKGIYFLEIETNDGVINKKLIELNQKVDNDMLLLKVYIIQTLMMSLLLKFMKVDNSNWLIKYRCN